VWTRLFAAFEAALTNATSMRPAIFASLGVVLGAHPKKREFDKPVSGPQTDTHLEAVVGGFLGGQSQPVRWCLGPVERVALAEVSDGLMFGEVVLFASC